jgi:SAM-dependent methyltransferase
MTRQDHKTPYSVFAQFYDEIATPLRGPMQRAREEILDPLIESLRERREREAARRLQGRSRVKSGAPRPESRVRPTPYTRLPSSDSRTLSPESRLTACDLCCGTGTTALEMARRGYRVFAVDRSRAMLGVAREKFRRARVDARIVRADMCNFRLPEPVNLVACEFDAINHLARKRDLQSVARAVARALRPSGWFFFDVNTPQAFRELWVTNWIVQGRGYFLAARGGYDERRDKGWTEFNWFVPAEKLHRSGNFQAATRARRAAQLLRHYTERYEQVAWTDNEIRAALTRAGLRVIGAWDLLRFARGEPWAKPGNRTFWLAQKSRG